MSALYEGVVSHRRRGEIEHAFRYRVFMAYVDLDAVDDAIARAWPLWGRGPLAPVRLRRSDHFGDPAAPLAATVRDLVEQRTGRRPQRLGMLTNLRAFGHCFNPVSFVWCFDGDGAVAAVVAEVTNTPWGERHAYVFEGERGRFAKALHVSPFMGMEHEYECEAPAPGAAARVRVVSRRGGERTFDAVLRLRRLELTRGNLARLLARHPFPTVAVTARIYGQALRLRAKGAPVFPHPRRAG